MPDRRLVIFAHFDRNDLIDAYVVEYLRTLYSLDSDIVFVSTSKLVEEEKEKIVPYCHQILCRKNEGYDFYSYRTGLFSVADFKKYEQIVLCNDSVYCQGRTMPTIFKEMEKRNVDFWGLTESFEGKPHIQSYFLVFNTNIIRSKAFYDFFNSIEVLSSKGDIVRSYEIGLTEAFMSAGFSHSVFAAQVPPGRRFLILLGTAFSIEYRTGLQHGFFSRLNHVRRALRWCLRNFHRVVVQDSVNPMHYYWNHLLEKNLPFIKIDLLRVNPLSIRDQENRVLQRLAFFGFPVAAIQAHLEKTKKHYNPN